MKRPVVLTIAGSDPSGGAGIQADLKTITAFGCYGMSVITAVTVQNTMGVTGVEAMAPDLVAAQLDAVFSDIRPNAVKIGMAVCRETIEVLIEKLTEYRAEHIVLDPVMISTSGRRLLSKDAVDTLIHGLLPLAGLSTPNLPECEALTGQPIRSREDMILASLMLHRQTKQPVLLKGGHMTFSPQDSPEGSFREAAPVDCSDLLRTPDGVRWYRTPLIQTTNSHGTGCTLSSAIASCLAGGLSLPDAVAEAKTYLSGALAAGLDLGKGNGPLDHCFRIKPLS
ncbi:bifunctional hydroxymethylpyrimidine kinase/phosphomethylpyrimidine kinase [Fusibacillus kribbianus]|uniref:Hydroxymethylpyrimidine/phosphomethylpyrimidine kinase n=1 Tax=Fusibacillus kribbianus TaxID=3044208 RepID=A0AAP4EZW7_9FIRM|nr:bifunctional hydroxymethylpyrimidine kinase/phosphomethylpyrimidine kinase [Ruminococcus sp. YH-rum2234]MDI9240898.1 bifunctional hydroxymethylpyrimidine kinase/phosphomethylpyrimidine kinase [Ruminococcus sp. YH-rum2234]